MEKSYIKWISEDDNGLFSLIGKVISFDETTITFVDNTGIEFCVPSDDGRFITITKREFDKGKTSHHRPTSITHSSHNRSKRGTKTKLDLVVELLESRRELLENRKEAINVIVDEIGMTPAGASTYFSNAKKKLM